MDGFIKMVTSDYMILTYEVIGIIIFGFLNIRLGRQINRHREAQEMQEKKQQQESLEKSLANRRRR